ncbi:histidine kinase [Halobacteriales archaeon QH_7_66_37]|nr:MAG: histidine kinase [Halobacteriales archaeon QH_7_66_37]
MGTVPGQIEPAAIDYVAVFGFAALACLLSVARAREIEAPDVRRGLVWLLWTTGCWALFQIGFLVLPDPLQEPAYTLGLVLGFATVWAWLYFCSAYAGRDFHRNATLRRLGAGTFLGVVAVKLTNPIHGLYFTTRDASEPFAHMAIEHGLFHWAVTGLSYVLATVGIFVLFELYFESGYDTRPLGALTGLLALPVTFEVVAVRSDLFVDMIYAPLGVAVFVIGVLFVYERRFLAVQSTGEDDDAVVFLDDEGRIRDVTPAAVETFPALGGAVGDPLADRLPDVAGAVTNGEEVVAHERDDETRYYFVSTSAVTLGNSEGTLVLFSDVTTAERRRRELDRHNTQLEGFANALAHELRNMLQIIDWRLALATDRLDEGTVEHESIESALAANERLADRVDDFTTLARYGQTVERFETVALGAAAENAWWHADTGEMSLEIDLFEDGFAIADDGEAPGEDAAGYLEFGESVPDAKSGMKLPNVRTFARVHGWRVAVDTGYQDGVRLVVDEVTVGIEAGAGNEDAAESEDAADRKGAAGADGQSGGHAEEGRS